MKSPLITTFLTALVVLGAGADALAQNTNKQTVRTNATVNKKQQQQAATPQPSTSTQRRPEAKPGAGAQSRSGATYGPGNGPKPDDRHDYGRPDRPGQGHADRQGQGHPDQRPSYGHPDRKPEPPRPEMRPGRHERPLPSSYYEPMRYDHAKRFWDSGSHYFGYCVHSLPPRVERRVYRGVSYYVYNDIFYRLVNGYYYVTRPPYGVEFRPSYDYSRRLCTINYYNGSDRAVSSRRLAASLGLSQDYADRYYDYYYDDGVFFKERISGRFVTVVPPAGAIVTELPDDYDVMYYNDCEYYIVDDTVYRAVAVDGRAGFEVLGQMK